MIWIEWAILGVCIMSLAGILWVAIEVDVLRHAWENEHPCVADYPIEEDEFGDEFDDISVEDGNIKIVKMEED